MHASIVQRLFFPHIVDDAFIEAIVGHVIDSVRELDVTDLRRRKAQRLIEDGYCLPAEESRLLRAAKALGKIEFVKVGA